MGFGGPWKTGTLRPGGVERDSASGSLGRITRPEELPPDRVLLGLIQEAIASLEPGKVSPRAEKKVVRRAAKPALEVPEDFTEAMRKVLGRRLR